MSSSRGGGNHGGARKGGGRKPLPADAPINPVSARFHASVATRLALERAGVKLGDRIEVCWLVGPSSAEGGAPFAKWWGARIERAAAAAATATADGKGGVILEVPSFVIAYDAEEGFAPEERRVQLLTEHDLFDIETSEELHWRRAGDAWEPPAGDDGGGEGDDSKAAGDQANV